MAAGGYSPGQMLPAVNSLSCVHVSHTYQPLVNIYSFTCHMFREDKHLHKKILCVSSKFRGHLMSNERPAAFTYLFREQIFSLQIIP